MKRLLLIGLSLAVLLVAANGLVGNAIAQDATPAVETVMVDATPAAAESCEGVIEYARILVTLGAGLAAASYGLPAGPVSEWTDEAYEAFVGVLTNAIAELTGVTPPEAAKKLNEYAIKALEVVHTAIVFIRTSGIGQSLPFVDQLDKVDDVITQAIATLEAACPGTAAAVGTPVASPAAG